MIDLALIVAVGMAVYFAVKARRSAPEIARLSRECDQQRKRAWLAEDKLEHTREVLRDTEAALHRKIEAEVTRVGGGKVA